MAAVVAISALVGCGSADRLADEAGLRTYPATVRDLCPASAAVDPVVGLFDGDPLADGDRTWLVAPDGRRLFVAWPAGFSLRFEPGPTLRDERDRIVAERSAAVTLRQVNRFDHAGTVSDPYLALGWVFDGCYARSR